MERLPNYDSWKTSPPDELSKHSHRCEFCDADYEDGVAWFADVGEWLCPEHRKETIRCDK